MHRLLYAISGGVCVVLTSAALQGNLPSPEELEVEFWNIVERGEEPVEVYYGADLNTGTVGSGFPRAGESDNPYATHKWNVNNFPKLTGEHESLLNHVNEAIQGVIIPWLYIGMCFSAFCWHVEDHMFYSINYNHYGAPKQWCDRTASSSCRGCPCTAIHASMLVLFHSLLLFSLLAAAIPHRIHVGHPSNWWASALRSTAAFCTASASSPAALHMCPLI